MHRAGPQNLPWAEPGVGILYSSLRGRERWHVERETFSGQCLMRNRDTLCCWRDSGRPPGVGVLRREFLQQPALSYLLRRRRSAPEPL